ncbi:MAG: carbohydrate kinase [Hyphomicrobiales bacterium]|nr:carbohydrate kinase [Hyphomicrobiales bacterium]PCJ89533.1 MAG: carbohydrate kinase [Hyphomicrobiales bacterium]
MSKDILIGIDAGTSVIKSVAFDLSGRQIDVASVPNRYSVSPDGAATQPLGQTWDDCATTLRDLGQKIPDLAKRTAAIAITGQGDGTWLVGKNDAPIGDGWLWLDSRATPAVRRLRATHADRARFEATGTGLNVCQQGTQLAYMQSDKPEFLEGAETALHCKDWLYLKMTGERVTDPSEAMFTFGNYQTRHYDDDVIEALGLTSKRSLLPPVMDGSKDSFPVSAAAAAQTGLLQGTPVCLGFVDVVCTAMGGGVYAKGLNVGCTILGTTGMHMRVVSDRDVWLNEDKTGYVMVLPMAGQVLQIQSNMAATLNLDWLLNVAAELIESLGQTVTHKELLTHVDRWISSSKPGTILYHPYISEAGERGPFVDSNARASFVGLNSSHRFGDMLRSVAEGLALATRDCYSAMGALPDEVRLSGGAAKSSALSGILAAMLNRPIRSSSREEAGAAGAAMMAALTIGAYDTMDDCVDVWVNPLLNEAETPEPELARHYDGLLDQYIATRQALEPIWEDMAKFQEKNS